MMDAISEARRNRSVSESYEKPVQRRFERKPVVNRGHNEVKATVDHVSSMLGFKNADKLVADTIARSEKRKQIEIINANKPVFTKDQAELMKALAFSNVDVSESKIFDYGDENEPDENSYDDEISQDDFENLD
jgi:hypothetical protein